MPPTDRSPAGDQPRILPLRLQGREEHGEQAPTLRGTLARLAADVVRSVRGLPPVTICVDVPEDHAADAAPEAVVAPLSRLLAAACAATAAPAPGRDCPRLREVVVTSVDTGDAVEIEVADSAAEGTLQAAAVAELRPLVEAAGWSLSTAACPDGGTAVTLRIPRRRGRSLAA